MARAIRIASLPEFHFPGSGVTQLVYLRVPAMSSICKHVHRLPDCPQAPPAFFSSAYWNNQAGIRRTPVYITKIQAVFDYEPLAVILPNTTAKTSGVAARCHMPPAACKGKLPPAQKRLPSEPSPASRRSPASHVGALRVISATLVNPHNVRSRAV